MLAIHNKVSKASVCSTRELDTVVRGGVFHLRGITVQIIIYNYVIYIIYIYATVSEKTDYLALMQFVHYGPIALQRSRSRDFAISRARCSTAS